jgi:TRAP-type C4-dicarboxylate transport system substrate-binding protein
VAFHHRSAAFRQFGLFVLTLALMAAFAITANPVCAQDFTLKFATQTINDIQHEYMKVFKTELEKASNGKIKVEVYPASQLGNFQRMMEGIRLGTIEAIIAPAEFYVAVDPRYQAIAMTGLWGENEHAIKILNLPETRQTIAALGEGRGYITASLIPYDTQLIGSKTPITKLADFAGKRIRVLASEAEQAQVKQGYLEGSNVSMIDEMATMITTLRAYESAQRAYTAQDESLGKLINEVSKFD